MMNTKIVQCTFSKREHLQIMSRKSGIRYKLVREQWILICFLFFDRFLRLILQVENTRKFLFWRDIIYTCL